MANVTSEPVSVDDMEVEEEFLRSRPPNTDAELDITPMIDIVFLLLIFFLVSSKMNAEQAVDLPKARHGSVIAGKESVIILMKRGSGDQAQVQKADGSELRRILSSRVWRLRNMSNRA